MRNLKIVCETWKKKPRTNQTNNKKSKTHKLIMNLKYFYPPKIPFMEIIDLKKNPEFFSHWKTVNSTC